MSKDKIIAKYGKNDGSDEIRYEVACQQSRILDYSPEQMFISLIKLENDGYISLAVKQS